MHTEPLRIHAERLSMHTEPLRIHAERLSMHTEPLRTHTERHSMHTEPLRMFTERLRKKIDFPRGQKCFLGRNQNRRSFRSDAESLIIRLINLWNPCLFLCPPAPPTPHSPPRTNIIRTIASAYQMIAYV